MRMLNIKGLQFIGFALLLWLVPSWLVKASILWLFAAHLVSKP